MTPAIAVGYSFLFGLLHGIVPDEHTWPITLSYALGGGTGRAGMKAGIYFSLAFAVQRALLSELAYLALAPFLLSPRVNAVVYVVVGVLMSIAGGIVLRRNRYVHVHFLGHHHERTREMERTSHVLARSHADAPMAAAPPVRWTLVHGFVAGFAIGGFSLFVMTVAAPAMGSAWLGFLPGLIFGLGTMLMLALIGGLFGASLRWSHRLSESEIRRIGAQTGGRTLFFGGLLFTLFGIADVLGLQRHLPVSAGYVLIGLFMLTVAIPAFVYSWREVTNARRRSGEA